MPAAARGSPAQIAPELKQLVTLTRVTFRFRPSGDWRSTPDSRLRRVSQRSDVFDRPFVFGSLTMPDPAGPRF